LLTDHLVEALGAVGAVERGHIPIQAGIGPASQRGAALPLRAEREEHLDREARGTHLTAARRERYRRNEWAGLDRPVCERRASPATKRDERGATGSARLTAAPGRDCLALLPSGSDAVHKLPPRGAWPTR